MKKSLITLTIMLAAAAMVAAFSCPAMAAVSGACVECHTMHNSQGGTAMAEDEEGNKTETPYAHLTMSSCVGCHFKATSVPAPKIDEVYPTSSTAGGTFEDSGTDFNDACVHNVDYATSLLEDTTITGAIPGGMTLGMNNTHGSADANDLTCAGANGCHGDTTASASTDPDVAIKGFHHGGKEGYRYLQISDGTAVAGNKSGDWELGGADATNHNVYSSSTIAGMSLLCGNCHKNFHGASSDTDVMSGGSWIRHPTDQVLPADWTPNVSDADLYQEHPFAFATVGSISTTASYALQGSPQVMCLSCHRAHGSPYDDILRWSYNTQNAGSGFDEGCLGCHSKQR